MGNCLEVLGGNSSHFETHTFPTAENSSMKSRCPGVRLISKRIQTFWMRFLRHRLASPCWLKYQSSSYMSRTPQKPVKFGKNPTIRLASWFRTHKRSIDLTFSQSWWFLSLYFLTFPTSKYPPFVEENHILLSSKLQLKPQFTLPKLSNHLQFR